jgi:hypothetical protein
VKAFFDTSALIPLFLLGIMFNHYASMKSAAAAGTKTIGILWTVLLQLGPQVWPGYRFGPVLFHGVKPAIEFGLLRGAQWQVLLL